MVVQSFNDTVFAKLETLIRTLPFENYDEFYNYRMIDGGSWQVEVKTNKISKKVHFGAIVPDGFGDLVSYVRNMNHDILKQ